MAEIISILQHKGGVGKTTSTQNIGACLANQGKKVLLIDLDSQGNLSHSFGILDAPETIHQCFIDRKIKTPLPIINVKENIDIVCSDLEFIRVEFEIMTRNLREYILKKLISPIKEKYDYIILDCSPSLGIISTNALVASDSVLIPMESDMFGTKGLTNLLNIIDECKTMNEKLENKGIFITKFIANTNNSKDVYNYISENYKEKFIDIQIRHNVSIKTAQTNGIDVFEFDKNCNGAKDYKKLTKYLFGE